METIETIGNEIVCYDNNLLKIVESIKQRKAKNKSCDLTSITEDVVTNDLDESTVKTSLDDLVEKQILGTRTYNNKTVYRILNNIESPPVSPKSNQTPKSPIMEDDFTDFKRFATDCLSQLNSEVESLKSNPCLPSSNSHNDLKCHIESKDQIIILLKEEVDYLRHQNNGLLEIIQRQHPQHNLHMQPWR